ncbi:hypothetical protein GCM10010389_02510 [Streptomyces echinoruber]|uniref:prolyl aminopeptidase n=1 Tax=Streptomyces echinoruber TaxID=68898 RepID=A0A918V5U9_9ACTN|nr:hypothetical protein GCM10010389_02510 [Streptomyces echinoruber]
MALYPETEPYEHGMLDVGDGNRVYWETCGNPRGKPAVVLHGGPGSGCSPFPRRLFDPAAYRIVLLDQRGCGRSTPHASAYDTDMGVNTTAHLIADLELLRRHLGIERWLVWGVSWGSVLGLRYAQTHPHAVSELVLTAVATGSHAEVELLTRGLGKIFPAAFARFVAELPEDRRDGNLAAAYHRLLESPDPADAGTGGAGLDRLGDGDPPGTAALGGTVREPGLPPGLRPHGHALLGQRPLPGRGQRRGRRPA